MKPLQIHPIKLRLSTAFLVIGDRPVLIDAGSPREEKRILKALEQHGVQPRDLSLIALTHAHTDHAGSAKALRDATGAPVALHPAGNDMLASGQMGRLTPVRPRHRLLELYVNQPFDGFTPDLALEPGMRLDTFGLPATVLETPGHTPHCVSFVADNGDAFAGDLVIGGFLGGLFDRQRIRLPYFAAAVSQIGPSVDHLLEHTSGTIYLGHGGPISVERLREWRSSNC